MERQKTHKSNTLLKKKNKAGAQTLSDFKADCNTVVIKTI